MTRHRSLAIPETPIPGPPPAGSPILEGRASFSRDRRYRYSLARHWGDGPRIAWVLLNPSTADARHDDPTIRRCIAYSQRWGFGGLEAVNLFALRTPHPAVLRAEAEPVGTGNDRAIQRALARADAVVVAWGNHGALHGRATRVRRWLPPDALALGLTRGLEPAHPLYLPGDRHPTPLTQLLAAELPGSGAVLCEPR